MTDTTPRATDESQETTQQLRVTPRMPRPLDPATPQTEVLSIHDLLDGADESRAERRPIVDAPAEPAPALTPLPPEPIAATEPAVTPEPVAAAAVPAPQPPARRVAPVPRPQSELGQRIRTDASAAWDGTRREVREWLARGDNALIAATAVVALLLVIVVAIAG